MTLFNENAHLLTLIAHLVFKPNALSRIMHKARDLEVLLQNRPDVGLIQKISSMKDGAVRLREEIVVVFDKPGRSYQKQMNTIC